MREQEFCEITCIHEEKINRINEAIAQEDFHGTAQLFKALADPTRLKIAYSLVQEGELCVCDVANIIQSSVATASHHLRLLRNMGLAKYRKEGKLVYYSLDDDHVQQLVEIAMIHHKEVNAGGNK